MMGLVALSITWNEKSEKTGKAWASDVSDEVRVAEDWGKVMELTLHVGLNLGVGELASNEALGVEDGVVRVHRDLVLGSISDEALRVGEGDIRRRGAVSLVLNGGNRKDGKTGQQPVGKDCK